MKILVGLGNPGDKYENHRHNVGFMAVDAIADHLGAGSWKRRFQGLTAEVDIGRERCLLLKPGTYMNESGRAVGEAIRFYKISPADLIVFHDELDLEPGKVRVKLGGGHAGHNGLKSISAHIGNDYSRVRIGIGHPGSREAVVGYVLHDFSKSDREWLAPVLDAIARGAQHLVAGQEARFLNEIARFARPRPESRKQETTLERIEHAAAHLVHRVEPVVAAVAAAASTALPQPTAAQPVVDALLADAATDMPDDARPHGKPAADFIHTVEPVVAAVAAAAATALPQPSAAQPVVTALLADAAADARSAPEGDPTDPTQPSKPEPVAAAANGAARSCPEAEALTERPAGFGSKFLAWLRR
jgi:PTH1 family peptidyl-tRNA hydrolase